MEKKSQIRNLLEKIKSNKKYNSIADEIIVEEIQEHFKKNNFIEDEKLVIKKIRAELHKKYSSYQTKKKKKRFKYLEDLKQNIDDKRITDKLLSMAISTKERLKDYPEIYKKLFKITGKPKSIIDLGTGLNPLSYPYMDLKVLKYYAYDINTEDIEFLNDYFKIMKHRGLKGKAKILNIKNLEKIKKLPNTDLIFLFKILDLIDIKNHKPSEELIKTLLPKTKFIIASFPTKTITRKKMNFPRRKWFELMLQRLNLKFQTIKTQNEIFYIIKK